MTLTKRITRCKARLTKLIRLHAPDIIINNEKRYLRSLLRLQEKLRVQSTEEAMRNVHL